MDTGWIVFAVVVTTMLALDLGVFNRKSHVVSIREATGWSIFWVSLAIAFGGWVWWSRGITPATEYLAAWLLEQSLSVDNLFVISVILTWFKAPPNTHHRILFWGILGAVLSRGLFIGLGIEILERFHFVTWLLGAFLIYTGVKLFLPEKEGGEDPGDNWMVRQARRWLPFSDTLDGDRFTTTVNGARRFTPLFLVLLVVESTDVIFAVDSIPAVLGITQDPFIVYTSNVFAILGLRSMYFVLADVVTRFHYMKHGLSVILSFVGAKMLFSWLWHVPTWLSLVVILVTLVVTSLASLIRERRVVAERGSWSASHPGVSEDGPAVEGAPDDEMSDVERLMFLHKLPTFHAVAIEDLRLLAPGMFLRRFGPGERVFSEGDDGDALYIIVDGTVRIERTDPAGAPVVIDVLVKEQYFGEMALFSGGPRSASAVADDEARLLVLSREPFLEAGGRHPKIFVEVIRVLSERLREADAHLARHKLQHGGAP